MSKNPALSLAAAIWESQRLLHEADQRRSRTLIEELRQVLYSPEVTEALNALETDAGHEDPE